MRSGELCALKWTDVNFETNEISITKTLYTPTNSMKNYKLTPPKTKAAIREIDVDYSVMSLLKAMKKKQLHVEIIMTKILFSAGKTYTPMSLSLFLTE
jgi:integrase